jgi:hypothetical protein
VPVPVDDVTVPGDLAGHGLVAVVSEADRGQDRPQGAGEGQVAGPDRQRGASLFSLISTCVRSIIRAIREAP